MTKFSCSLPRKFIHNEQLDEMLVALARDAAPIGSSTFREQAKAASTTDQAVRIFC